MNLEERRVETDGNRVDENKGAGPGESESLL